MIPIFRCAMVVVLASGLNAVRVSADEAPSAPAQRPDAEAIEKVVTASSRRYAELFAKQDAAGLAELFTPEAEYVDSSGEVFHGRDVIQAELAATFEASRRGTLDIALLSIRPIADGLLVEEGNSTFHPEEDGPVSQTRYVALHARQKNGTWLLAAVRELAPPALTAHEQLKSLSWLVGQWREESADGVVKTAWRWSEDGVALIAQFTMQDAQDRKRTGTHRVGWDPERKQFRSWVFDSTGGFADGWWSAGDDEDWSVQLTGVDADGVRISSVVSYTREGPDRLTIAQRDSTRGGESVPARSARVVRQPPAPSTPAK